MKIYRSQGVIGEADCVIGHSFGTSTDTDSVNNQLAHQILNFDNKLPMIADRTLVNVMPVNENRLAHIVEGEVTNIKAQGVGTWGTLIEAQQYMAENALKSPIMIAQAFHIRRIVMQAAKLGMTSIVPDGLPTGFDKNSEQIWTRSPYLWIPFNALGSILLKKRGQL
ncbi:MAG: hypothetical protein NVSMB70_14720 [Chamaesiphon sp.]